MSRDPLAARPLPPELHARRLAELLRSTDLGRLLEVDITRWNLLADLTRVGDDPVAAAAFVDELGVETLLGLLAALARDVCMRAFATDGGRAAIRSSAAAHALASVLGAAWGTLGFDRAAARQALARVDPATSALVATHAALPTGDLVAVVTDGLRSLASRESELAPGPPWALGQAHPGSLLLDAAARDAIAARAVVRAWPSHQLDALLGAGRPEAVVAFLGSATDPASGTTMDIAPVLTAVVGFLERERWAAVGLEPYLGGIVAPWLDAVVLGAPLTGDPAPWDWGQTDHVEALRWICTDAAASRDVADAAALLLPAGALAALEGAHPSDDLRQLGLVAGTAQRAVGDGHVARAEGDGLLWDLAFDVVGGWIAKGGTALATAVGGAAGWAMGAGITFAASRLGSIWRAAGLPGPPPTPTDVARLQAHDAGQAQQVHEASVLAAALARSQARGELPADVTALTPVPGDDLVTWLERIGTWEVDTGAGDVAAALDAFGHGYGVGLAGPASSP
jgi:hypothetical protein